LVDEVAENGPVDSGEVAVCQPAIWSGLKTMDARAAATYVGATGDGVGLAMIGVGDGVDIAAGDVPHPEEVTTAATNAAVPKKFPRTSIDPLKSCTCWVGSRHHQERRNPVSRFEPDRDCLALRE
jgi:hypothetical protein